MHMFGLHFSKIITFVLFYGGTTNVSQLIIEKITCIKPWYQINYYISNYIGKIYKRNTHGNTILELQKNTDVRKVRCVSTNIASNIQHGSTHA